MYAVIFKAEIADVDEEYFETAKILRDLAMDQYNCVAFNATTEGNQEIAISYWKSLEAIKIWKKSPLHQKAQALGHTKWYKTYQVEVVKILEYYQS